MRAKTQSLRAVLTVLALSSALNMQARAETPRPLHKPAPPALAVSMNGDELFDCTRIAQEIAVMEDMIYSYDAAEKAAGRTGTGISIAQALGGFLVGSVPGAIGVLAAGHVAGEAVEDRARDAQAMENTAAQRRSLMIGMYNAKQCKAPIHSQRALREAAIPAPLSPATPTAQNVARLEPAAGTAVSRRDYSGSAMNVRYND